MSKSKTLGVFCHIRKYLEKTGKKNNDLLELLDDYCVAGKLRPSRFYNGCAFIIPTDKTIKALESSLGENNWQDGQKICLTHIINDSMQAAKDWDLKKKDIPTATGKKLEVKSVAGKTVTLANGVVLERDVKYVSAGNHNNTSVWLIKKGDLTYDAKAPAAEYTYAKKDSAPPVKGGASRTIPDFNALKFVKAKLGEYVSALNDFRTSEKLENPFAEAVADMMTYIDNHSDLKVENYYCCVTPGAFSSMMCLLEMLGEKSLNEWYYQSKHSPNDGDGFAAWAKKASEDSAEKKHALSHYLECTKLHELEASVKASANLSSGVIQTLGLVSDAYDGAFSSALGKYSEDVKSNADDPNYTDYLGHLDMYKEKEAWNADAIEKYCNMMLARIGKSAQSIDGGAPSTIGGDSDSDDDFKEGEFDGDDTMFGGMFSGDDNLDDGGFDDNFDDAPIDGGVWGGLEL